MIVVRKRLFIWLIKAYIKRWGKAFFLFFIVGIILCVVALKFASSFVSKVPASSFTSIGVVGDYKLDNVPKYIVDDLSLGLTKTDTNGNPLPSGAKSWKIKNDGKTYEFTLNTALTFTDGSSFDSSKITYNFSDATISKPNKDTIIFTLKNPYNPFLVVTVTQPIFKAGFVGLGDYKIRNIELNGEFIKSISLSSVHNSLQIKTYHFYPSTDALKLAYLLGEVQSAWQLPDTKYKKIALSTFKNTRVEKKINYSKLVTLFFNTKDTILSDEKIRNALTYALPDNFQEGQRNSTPFAPTSWVYSEGSFVEKKQDREHAKELLTLSSASSSADLNLVIKTIPKYKKTAEDIKKSWKEIGIASKVEEVESVPQDFQIFLGDFSLSKDPDQYVLWHSSQVQNITHYQNLRIDKLLEDGRRLVLDVQKRRKMYEDFQKYLLADSPVAFLYFPVEYNLIRK